MASFLDALPETEIVPAKDGERALKKLDERMERKNRRLIARLVQGSSDATKVDDSLVLEDGVEIRPAPPEGWSKQRYRIACDLRRPQKMQPGYVQLALKVFQSYRESERPTGVAPLAAEIKVYVAEAHFNYPRRVIEEE